MSFQYRTGDFAIINQFFTVLITLSISIAWYFFYKNRKKFPISGRMPITALTLNGLIIFGLIFIIIFSYGKTDSPLSCLSYWIQVIVLFLPIIWLIFVRAFVLLFNFEITNALIEYHHIQVKNQKDNEKKKDETLKILDANNLNIVDDVKSNSNINFKNDLNNNIKISKRNWFIDHIYCIRPYFLKRMHCTAFGFICLIIIATTLILYFQFPNGEGISLECSDPRINGSYNQMMQIVAYLPLFVNAICICVIGYKLKKHATDGYGLKSELKTFAFTLIICGSIWFTLVSILPGHYYTFSESDLLLFNNLGIVILAVIISSIILIWPLYLTWRHQQLIDRQTIEFSRIKHIKDLLIYPNGYESFLKFVTSQFAAEQLLFWKKVTDYKNKYEPYDDCNIKHQILQQVIEDCKIIIDTHVKINSPFEINISAQARSNVMNKFSKLHNKIIGVNNDLKEKEKDKDKTLLTTTTTTKISSSISSIIKTKTGIETETKIKTKTHTKSTKIIQINEKMNEDLLSIDNDNIETIIFEMVHLFDVIQEETLNLMQTNSFHQFKLSEIYKNLFDNVSKNNDNINDHHTKILSHIQSSISISSKNKNKNKNKDINKKFNTHRHNKDNDILIMKELSISIPPSSLILDRK